MITNLLSVFILLNTCRAEPVYVGGVVFESSCLEATSGQSALAISDVDRDGHLDLLVANLEDNNVIVFVGNGHGDFSRLESFPAGKDPTDIVAEDINADGLIDLVFANHETSYLTLLLGDGRGRFKPASNSPLIVDIEPHPHAVGVEDLNGDGVLDLIVDDRSRGGLLVLMGRGKGLFEANGTFIDVGADPYRGFATGDLNGDGLLDFVTPNPHEVAVMIRTDSASFRFTRTSTLQSSTLQSSTLQSSTLQSSTPQTSTLQSSNPFSVAIADINGDTFSDVISASEQNKSSVRIFLGNGQGAFSEADESPFAMASGGKEISIGDLNGDSIDDVLISSWSSDVLILIGGPAGFSAVRLSGMDNPWGLATGDLNEDGIDDFVIADGVDSEIRIFTSGAQ